MDGFDQ